MTEKPIQFNDPLRTSPLTNEIVKWIFEHEGQTAGQLHVHVSDKKDLAYWVAALSMIHLFNKDFVQKLNEIGIRCNDIISIKRGKIRVIARFVYYDRAGKVLVVKLRSINGDEMEERWPLVDPLCLSRLSKKGMRLSPQRDTWKRFSEGYDGGQVTALDKILGIQSFGNRSLFTSGIVLITASIKKARNFLDSFEVCDESLGNVIGCDKNLVFKNSLSDLLWTDGDAIKREIRSNLISVLFKGSIKDLILEKWQKSSSVKAVNELLDEIEKAVRNFDDRSRMMNFINIITNLKIKLENIEDPIFNDNFKFILVDDPSLVLKEIKSYNMLTMSGKRIIIFSDTKSIVNAFQNNICYDNQYNILKEFSPLLDDVVSIFNFEEKASLLEEQAQELYKSGEYNFIDQDVWLRNFRAARFKISIKEISVGDALEKVIKFRKDILKLDGLFENDKLRRLVYTYLIPLADLVTSAPIYLDDNSRVLILDQLTQFNSEINEGDYLRFLPENVSEILEHNKMFQLFSNALIEIEMGKKDYFIEEIPQGYSLKYTGKYQDQILVSNRFLYNDSQATKKAFLSATKSNFRQVIDECMQRNSNSVCFLGNNEECRYIEYRIKQAFWLPDCVLKSSFFPISAVSFNYIQRIISEAAPNQDEKIESVFEYLSDIQITPSGTFSKYSNISYSSDRKVKSGLLYFEGTREMFYPLEGRKIFAIPAHTKNIIEYPLAELESGDIFIYIPDLSAMMKRSIQEAISVYNIEAYRMIYEWRDILGELSAMFGDGKELAEALLNEEFIEDANAIRNMRFNISRWLNVHSDIWTPDEENLKIIYSLAARYKIYTGNNIDQRIDVIRKYVNYAQEARKSVKSKLQRLIQNIISPNNLSFGILNVTFEGKNIEVLPLRITANRLEGVEVDSSYMYRLKNSSE